MNLDSIKREVKALKSIGSINTVRVDLIIQELIQTIEEKQEQLYSMYDENANMTEKMVDMVDEIRQLKNDIRALKIGKKSKKQYEVKCERCGKFIDRADHKPEHPICMSCYWEVL